MCVYCVNLKAVETKTGDLCVIQHLASAGYYVFNHEFAAHNVNKNGSGGGNSALTGTMNFMGFGQVGKLGEEEKKAVPPAIIIDLRVSIQRFGSVFALRKPYKLVDRCGNAISFLQMYVEHKKNGNDFHVD